MLHACQWNHGAAQKNNAKKNLKKQKRTMQICMYWHEKMSGRNYWKAKSKLKSKVDSNTPFLWNKLYTCVIGPGTEISFPQLTVKSQNERT